MSAASREQIAGVAQARGWKREPGVWCDTYHKPGRDSLYVEFSLAGRVKRVEVPPGTPRPGLDRLQRCLRYLSGLASSNR